MESAYILALDQGTSATKAVLFDRFARVACRSDIGHTQFYPHEGWVEFDAQQVYQNAAAAIRGVLEKSGADPRSVAALSITNQTETFVVWDKTTGRPVGPAIGWQDNRAEDICASLAAGRNMVEEKTGIMLSAYYSAAKLKWMFSHIPGLRERAEKGEVLFGTVESWLVWKLTGGTHVSDFCNASRSQLLNIHTLSWDPDLLRLFGFPARMFPTLKSCDEIFGHARLPGLPAWPITGVIGDSPGALYGQLGTEIGSMKVTYGTGSSVLMNLGDRPGRIGGGILTTIGWVLGGRPTYVCEGSVICSGATIRWLEQNLKLIGSSSESEAVAAEVPDTGGVYLVPAFTGMGVPYWDADARAAILGMTQGTGRAHIVRAGLESIAYQVRDAVEAMRAHSDILPGALRADGGASRNRLLMQFQSDILDQIVVCSAVEESSALGAAIIGGCAVGFWQDPEELHRYIRASGSYAPSMPADRREALYHGWKEAVRRVLTRFEGNNEILIGGSIDDSGVDRHADPP